MDKSYSTWLWPSSDRFWGSDTLPHPYYHVNTGDKYGGTKLSRNSPYRGQPIS